jgi:hypothetical protein
LPILPDATCANLIVSCGISPVRNLTPAIASRTSAASGDRELASKLQRPLPDGSPKGGWLEYGLQQNEEKTRANEFTSGATWQATCQAEKSAQSDQGTEPATQPAQTSNTPNLEAAAPSATRKTSAVSRSECLIPHAIPSPSEAALSPADHWPTL